MPSAQKHYHFETKQGPDGRAIRILVENTEERIMFGGVMEHSEERSLKDVQDQSIVTAQLDMLADQLEMLDARVTLLHDRLQPVLKDVPQPAPEGIEDLQKASPLAMTLHDLITRANASCQRLWITTEMLDI